MTPTADPRFAHLFEPFQLGQFTVRNRIKYAACCISNFCTPEGYTSPREFARMESISRCDAGIITNQGAYPDERGEGRAYLRQLALYSDKFIPSLSRVADLIHRNNSLACQQILHGGRYGGIELDYCLQPSPTPQSLKHFRPPREMTRADIRRAIDDHVEACRRAVQAGFDIVEITSFMGYLMADFLSGYTNQRTDEYGGSLANRCRFMTELIGEIKGRLPATPLVVRLNGVELMDEFGGNSQEECLEIMKVAETAGCDMISLVIGWHESRQGALGRDVPLDGWLPISAAVKREIKIPVAFGPRLADPFLAERGVAAGQMDVWEVCRPLLADPAAIVKTRDGRPEEIRPCIGDLTCLAHLFSDIPYKCTMNPRLGHEVEPEYDLTRAVTAKRVVVAGAGPAGLEFAVTAAQRGHDVTVYEARDRIGGQTTAALRELSGGEAMGRAHDFYRTMVAKHGVKLVLGTAVTPALVKKLKPDVVAVATGVGLPTPTFPTGDLRTLSALAFMDGGLDDNEVGERVVVVSSERIGLVTAEYLAASGKRVTLLEAGKQWGRDLGITFRWRHKQWLDELGVRVLTQTQPLGAEGDGVRVRLATGQEEVIGADTLLFAGPRRSEQDLLLSCEYLCDEIYILGDAVAPRDMHNAIRDGYRLGVRV
ncbi:MAG: oxidoreductase [Deferrisomatales bacterium]